MRKVSTHKILFRRLVEAAISPDESQETGLLRADVNSNGFAKEIRGYLFTGDWWLKNFYKNHIVKTKYPLEPLFYCRIIPYWTHSPRW